MAGLAALATLIVIAGAFGLRAATKERRERLRGSTSIPPMGAFVSYEIRFVPRKGQLGLFGERDSERLRAASPPPSH